MSITNTEVIKAIDEGLEHVSSVVKEKIAKVNERIDQIVAKNGRLALGSTTTDLSNTGAIQYDAKELIRASYNDIKGGIPFVSTKTVGAMTLGNNLTGTSQVSYTSNPIMRAYHNPHLYDLFRVVPTETGNVTFPRAVNPVGTGSFGTQTEGQSKAQLDYDLAMVNISVPFVAGYAKVSRQMLQDLPFLENYLSQSLTEDWNRAVDNKFMATITASATPGATSETEVAERVVDYIAQLNNLGFGSANAIITTHAVWATILKTLPSNGSYSVPGGVTIGNDGGIRIAGVPLITHQGVPTGRIYVLNTDAFSIAQASGLSIRSTEANEDDFIKNMIAYRCEARVELMSFQPTAAVYGSAA